MGFNKGDVNWVLVVKEPGRTMFLSEMIFNDDKGKNQFTNCLMGE